MGVAAIPTIINIAQNPGFQIALAAVVGLAAAANSGNIRSSTSEDAQKYGLKIPEEECCCGQKPRCYRLYFIKMKSKKEAKEAALHYPGSHGVMYHPHNNYDNFPHYHPTYDYAGIKKIPGVHFQFPR